MHADLRDRVERAGRGRDMRDDALHPAAQAPGASASLRILHVIPSVSASHGGPSEAIALMEHSLAALGVDVETATSDDGNPLPRNATQGDRAPGATGASRRHYFRKRLDFYKVCPTFVPWMLRHARNYDVIHVHGLFSFMSVAAAAAAWIRGVPYVIRPLGSLGRYGITQRRPLFKRLSLAVVEGPLLRRAAAVHFTSDAERIEAEALGIAMRSRVVALGVAMRSPGDPQAAVRRFPKLAEGNVMLFLSRIDPKKNLNGLLRAFAQALPALGDWRLAVAGTGDAAYVRSLQSLAEQLQIVPSISWLGDVRGELKDGVFARSRVFVLPSHSENFGIAAAEALAAGLPCLLSHQVPLVQAVERGGAGLSCGTEPARIAEALRELLSDDQRLDAMAIRARHLAAAEFSDRAMALNLLALYQSLARPRPDAGVARLDRQPRR